MPATTTYGMPIGEPLYVPAPKSGCSPVVRPMLAISASESGATAAEETSVFQGLPDGNASAPLRSALLPSEAREKSP